MIKYINGTSIIKRVEEHSIDVLGNQENINNKDLQWLQHGCKITIFIPNLMKTSKRGFLLYNKGQW